MRDLVPYLRPHWRVLLLVSVVSVFGAAVTLAQPALVAAVIGAVERSEPLRPSFLRSYVGIRRPHLVLGECCVCEWRGFWILRFWEMPLFSNIAFFETCDFRKSALRLYEG